jgi:hypothetical protein
MSSSSAKPKQSLTIADSSASPANSEEWPFVGFGQAAATGVVVASEVSCPNGRLAIHPQHEPGAQTEEYCGYTGKNVPSDVSIDPDQLDFQDNECNNKYPSYHGGAEQACRDDRTCEWLTPADLPDFMISAQTQEDAQITSCHPNQFDTSPNFNMDSWKLWECRCGRALEPQEVWDYATIDCPSVSKEWRSSENVDALLCMNHPQLYSSSSENHNLGRYILGSYISNTGQTSNPCDEAMAVAGAASVDCTIDDGDMQLPMSWFNLGEQNVSPDNYYDVSVPLRSIADDGRYSVRAVDAFGDGWKGYSAQTDGHISIFQNADNKTESNSYRIEHSWIMQDAHRTTTGGTGRFAQQQMATRICDSNSGNYVGGTFKAFTKFCPKDGKLKRSFGNVIPTCVDNEFGTNGPSHRQCRDKCRGLGADCTHYAWFITAGPYRRASWGYFDDGVATRSVGTCLTWKFDLTELAEAGFGNDDSSSVASDGTATSASAPASGAASSVSKSRPANNGPNQVLDCPTREFRAFRDTAGVHWEVEVPVIIFKHRSGSLGQDYRVYQHKIETFGEEFEIRIDPKDCPPGYYCPQNVPGILQDTNTAVDLTDYYNESTPDDPGVMKVSCANFPYNGPENSALASSSTARPQWYNENLHGTDFGSTFNYYCPGGTPYPVQVKEGLCASQGVAGDKYRHTAQGECPGLHFVDEKDRGLNISLADYVKNVGAVVRPGTAEFSLRVKNRASYGQLNFGFQLSTKPWLLITPQSSYETLRPLAFKEFQVEVLTGDIDADRDQDGDTATAQLVFWWNSDSGLSGSGRLNVTVEPKDTDKMLVFPFTISETVRAGKSVAVSAYVFNVAGRTDLFFLPYVTEPSDEVSKWLSFDKTLVKDGEDRELPCIIKDPVSDTTEYYEKVADQCKRPKVNNIVTPRTGNARLATKAYQRIALILNGSVPSSPEALTTQLEISTCTTKSDGSNNEDANEKDSCNPEIAHGPDFKETTSRLSVSLLITPGEASAQDSTTSFSLDMPSSSANVTLSRQCYVDCADTFSKYFPSDYERITEVSTNSGWDESKSRDFPGVKKYPDMDYGQKWMDEAAGRGDEYMVRWCDSSVAVPRATIPLQRRWSRCGDCSAEVAGGRPPSKQCAGIREQTLSTTRSEYVRFRFTPRDIFGTKTSLAGGDEFTLTLVYNISAADQVKHENDASYTCASIDPKDGSQRSTATAIETATGSGTYEAAIKTTRAGTYFLCAQLVKLTNNGEPRSFHVRGSPFVLESTDRVCADTDVNSIPNSDGTDCECSAGYFSKFDQIVGSNPDDLAIDATNGGTPLECVQCPQGYFKSVAGNSVGCDQCETGKTSKRSAKTASSPGGLLTSCELCPGGKSTADPSKGCTSCEQNTFRPHQLELNSDGSETEIKDCEECPAGFLATGAGSLSCKLCPSGAEYIPSALADGRKAECESCPAGSFRAEQEWSGVDDIVPTSCELCPVGYMAGQDGESSCTACPAGRSSGIEPGATECISCKATPDIEYAPAASSKCTACVSPLEIRTGSQAKDINDCVCPAGTYLSSGSVEKSPVCSVCPTGGICAQGTNNITEIRAEPGYWRPNKITATFWSCPVSTLDGTKWRNWMTCYGGTDSTCAPVFDWREGYVQNVMADMQEDGARTSVYVAMMNPVVPKELLLDQQNSFSSWMNRSGANAWGLKLAHAIAAYIDYVHATEIQPNNEVKQFTEFVKTTPGIWLGFQYFSSDLLNVSSLAKADLVKGYMSGPLCAICPPGTGRNGDYKSDSLCEPCPSDPSQNNAILFGLFVAVLVMVIFFVYGQIKKGAHEVHLEQEHLREHTSKKKGERSENEVCSLGDEDDSDDSESVKNRPDKDDDDDSSQNDMQDDAGSNNEENVVEGKTDGHLVAVPSTVSTDGDASDDDDSEEDVDNIESRSVDVILHAESKVMAHVEEGTISFDRSRRRRRGSTTEYVKPETHFSKKSFSKTLLEHQEAVRAHGTLSGNAMSHKQVLTGMQRIMMSYLQVVAVARAVPIAWPDAVISVLDFFAIVSAPSLSLVSVDCALSSDNNAKAASEQTGLSEESSVLKPVYAKFVITMLIPVFAIVAPALFWFIYYMSGKLCIKKRSCRRCCEWEDELPPADENYYDFQTVDDVNEHKHKKQSTERFKVTLMVVFFLFYPTIIKGVFGMFSCQSFGDTDYLIADMSVECFTPEHNTFVVLAGIFFVLFVIGIPVAGCFILHHFMPGINFDPTLPISQFNPRAGREYERKDRALLLRLKLEATAVYGFMWEGLQHHGLAPYWEWSVIMSRKAMIIAIIQLLQNVDAKYQLTIALIVLFGYNLLHVKYHPYDLFYHDRLEFLSLMSSEMTLFGGLVIVFLDADNKNCQTDCDVSAAANEAHSDNIGVAIIVFNCLYLVYFAVGMFYHLYFVMVPARCRCKKFEEAAVTVHESIPTAVGQAVFPNAHHAYVDHHPEDKRDFSSSHVVRRAETELSDSESSDAIAKEASVLMREGEEDAKRVAKIVHDEQEKAHARVQARLREKAAKKKAKKSGQRKVVIEMVEDQTALAVAAGKSGEGKGEDDTDSDSISDSDSDSD